MNEMDAELVRLLESGLPAALATIVRTKGSTPRGVGARMIIRPGGQISGTIGGGCGEADVWAEAMDVLDSGRPRVVQVDLLEDDADQGGRACGGIMYVFVEPLLQKPFEPGEVHMRELLKGIDGGK